MAMTRKEKYNLIKNATGDSQLARKARDWGADRIRRELNLSLPVRESKAKPQRQPEKVQKEVRQAKAREQYHEARRLGYTPEEATRMRYWSRERFRNTVQSCQVVDQKSRDIRWAEMAKRDTYSDFIRDEAQRINKELGLDKDAKPGWASVYYWYIFGGNISDWQAYMERALDPFIPEVYRPPML